MTDWERLWDIFHEARAKEPAERRAYLEKACGNETDLRREIEELLAAETEAAEVLRTQAQPTRIPGDAFEEVAQEEYSPGQILSNKFQIVKSVGHGGMGTVYMATDMELTRTVALKFLHTDDPRFARRFQLEARFQARIDHPNICKVYEVGETDNRQFIAMQFISGETMQDAAKEMTIQQKVRVLIDVCSGLQAAHNLGVIHRDIKPTNILVVRTDAGEWTPYITDFGLARELAGPGLTTTGMVMGTASYMAPEQARGEIRTLDRRCDIHALGATLYELLCGNPPFEGKSTVEVLAKVMNEDPPPLRRRDPGIPADLDTIVQKCLQKEPGRRYETAAALSEDLERFLRGEPVLAQPVTLTRRAVLRVKRYPVVSALLAAAFAAIVGLAGFAGWTWWRAQAQSKLANEFEQEIRFMEETARHAYTSPTHNVLREEAIVEQRLKAIEQKVREAGSVAEGPGQFALGRGYMALYRYPEARTHLEQAWKEYRIPRVAFALGVTLALLYQKELERADRIPGKKDRDEKKQSIDKEFKEPALHLIAEGRSAVEAAEYVEGLIAFLEKQYDEALHKTAVAFQKQPWLYEAKKLEADTFRAMGNERRSSGDPQGAIELYKKAEAAYRETVAEGSSYWLGYGSLCALGHDWTTLMMYQTGFPDEEVLRKSVDACNSSLRINPDRPEAYIAKAALKGAWGSYQMSRGQDPTASFNESIESARSALKWDWVRFAAYTNMAVAYSRRSAYEIQAGKDATESLQQSIECSRQAVLLNPNSAPFRNNLGISLAIKAGYDLRHGKNIEALQGEAIREFREAVRIAPDFDSAYNSLGEIFMEKARAQYDRGEDPRSFCQESIANLKKATEVNATFVPSYINLGENFKLQSLYGIDSGLDPSATLEQSAKNFAKAMELDPQNADAAIGQAGVFSLQAEYALNQKGDPSVALSQAIEMLQKAEKIAPGNAELPGAWADVELQSARWKGGRGRAEIQSGLKHIRERLSAHPNDAVAHAVEGSLLLLQARMETSAQVRRQTARDAAASMQEAFRLNAHLAPKYRAALDEARQLAGS